MFHVYDKKTHEVIFASLSTDELEQRMVNKTVEFNQHEIVPLVYTIEDSSCESSY
jgi:hypothetical protein